MNGSIRAALTLVAGLAIAACGSPSGTAGPTAGPTAGGPGASVPGATAVAMACEPATAAGSVQVAVKDFEYSPATITAKPGDTVTWTNAGPTGHTATLDDVPSCDTGTIASGATGSITFTAPGTYAYHCTIHPTQMKGTITVSG